MAWRLYAQDCLAQDLRYYIEHWQGFLLAVPHQSLRQDWSAKLTLRVQSCSILFVWESLFLEIRLML